MKPLDESFIKPEIPLVAVGCDFRIASSTLREKLVTGIKEREVLYKSIKTLDDSAGILVLETCNRLEWIVSTQYPDWISELLNAWIKNRWQESFPKLSPIPTPYRYIGESAVKHILRVVLGMESLAVGEAQIAGQFQDALLRSQKEKISTPILNRLSHIAGRIAKSGYKIGFRCNYRQGIHGLVAQYLEKQFQNHLQGKNILVVGMGEIGRRAFALLQESYLCNVQAINRTIKPEHEGLWQPLSELKQLSHSADAVIIATGAPYSIVGKENFLLSQRQEALLIMDIGIPLQVSEDVRTLEGVIYRNIDHLLEVGKKNEDFSCNEELDKEMQKEINSFKQYCRGHDLSALLSQIQNGRLELTENRIPQFIDTHLSDLEITRRKKIEKAMKQFVKDYSNEIFYAFHHTLEEYWSKNNND